MTSTTKRQNIHIHQHSHNTKTMHRSKGTFNTERYNTITSHAPTKQRSHLDQSTTPLFPEPLPGTSTQPCRYSEHILTVNSPTRVAYPYLDARRLSFPNTEKGPTFANVLPPIFPEPLSGTSTQTCRYSEPILPVISPTRVA